MANQDIRSYAKEKGIKLWQVAEVKGISEPTMTRLMRTEMSNETKADIIHIIDELADKCISKTKTNKKSGHWILEFGEIICSNCTTHYCDDIVNMCYEWNNGTMSYCPNCGADMRELNE